MSFQIYQGDCFELLERVHSIDHAIFDPPYSEHVHSKSRAGNRKKPLLNGNGHLSKSTFSREVDFGFDPIDVTWMEQMSDLLFDRVKRWVLVFCDVESSHLWIGALVSAGFDYCRTGFWEKIGATPQFTGDRPGVACEAIVCCHKPGRKRWNGGGKAGIWKHWTCIEHGGKSTANDSREHPTQKPLPLMLDLVRDFTDPGETILDPTMGAGTTGVACVRLGRSFVGIEKIEKHFETAKTRLEAETIGSDAVSFRAGQLPMFGGGQ